MKDVNEAKRAGSFSPDDTQPMADQRSAPRSALADLWRPLAECGDWLDEEPPRRAWLLTDAAGAGVLPLGKVGMLAAAGSAGKSWLGIQLALAVATRRDWFGWRVDSPGRVLLALGEEDKEEARARLYHAAQALDLSEEERTRAAQQIWVLPLAGRQVAMTQEGDGFPPAARDDSANGLPVTELFWEMVERLEDGAGSPDFIPWRLLVLDPLSRFAGPEVEVDSAQATRFVQTLERLTAPKHGRPTVLVCHHTNKLSRRADAKSPTDAAAATASRGSSALTDGVRWQAVLDALPRHEGTPELVTVNVVKSNYARYPSALTLARMEHGPMRLATPAETRQWEAADQRAQSASRGRGERSANATSRRIPFDPDGDD